MKVGVKTSARALVVVAMGPFLVTTACDMLSRKDDAAPASSAAAASSPAPVAPPAASTGATAEPTGNVLGNRGTPAATVRPVVDGGAKSAGGGATLALPDAGALLAAVDGGKGLALPSAWPSAFPSSLPSGFPTALPSGLPSSLPPIPSGFKLPGFPGDAGH